MTADTNTVAHSRTITGFFDTKTAADHAVAQLEAAGIPSRHITLVQGHDGVVATPAAHVGGFWESMKEMFLPEEDKHAYAEGLRRGGYLLSVNADEANYTKVLDIIDMDGSVDMDEREASWKSEGWTGYAAPVAAAAAPVVARPVVAAPVAVSAATQTTTAMASAPAARLGQAGQDETIQLVEEQLRVGKRDVNHGRVRLRSYVVSTPVTEQVRLHSETVQVDRKAVNRPVSGTEALFRDRTIEVEEHVEEAVVAKDVRVVEEISLRKTAEDRVQTITDTVRHTEVEVEDARKPAVGNVRKFVATSDMALIVAHMDVIASDGTKVGTVDHVDGPDRIKLARTTSPDGQHHVVPLAWVDHVDQHVHLNKASAAVKAGW